MGQCDNTGRHDADKAMKKADAFRHKLQEAQVKEEGLHARIIDLQSQLRHTQHARATTPRQHSICEAHGPVGTSAMSPRGDDSTDAMTRVYAPQLKTHTSL